MKTVWQDTDVNGDQIEKSVTAPLSLIISAFAPVQDVRRTLTPLLDTRQTDSQLILIDLGEGKNRLAASALAQVYQALGKETPDVDDAKRLKQFFAVIRELNRQHLIEAYHDRSDGGLFATLAEMAFASHTGLSIDIATLKGDVLAILFNEELGAVIQVANDNLDAVLTQLSHAGLEQCVHSIGQINATDTIVIKQGNQCLLSETRVDLQRAWSETSYRIQALRDNPQCAQQEFDSLLDADDPGLNVRLSFDINEDIAAPLIKNVNVNKGARPKIAILREQGVNGQLEMAAAFDRAGFTAIDVHMSDLMSGQMSLTSVHGMVACGGFSYGDVLGAGEGWAKSILFNPRVRDEFETFFNRADSFGLGVCNGCQMMSNLHELIPGAEAWPHFVYNRSEQFEARFSLVEILESPSLFLRGMAGSRMPIAVAHGEGRTEYVRSSAQQLLQQNLAALRFIDHYGKATENYPANPNGSALGITGVSNRDGRFTIMMPHPERVFRTVQNSWHPKEWQENSPWIRMFRNARVAIG